MRVRRLGARVERLCVRAHAERIAAAAACGVDAVYAAGRKLVVVICRGEGRAWEGKVHVVTCEECRAGREALAGERPVTLATHSTTHDE